MHILFIHQNYPAQFGHLARYLVQRKGFRCTFLSQHAPGVDGGVERIQYLIQGGATPQTHYCSASFENATWHSHAIYEALKAWPSRVAGWESRAPTAEVSRVASDLRVQACHRPYPGGILGAGRVVRVIPLSPRTAAFPV